MTTSQKPYLIRALYEWCEDNNFMPYLVTHVDDATIVPKEYVEDGRIVLNISSTCTQELLIENDWISFRAGFNGVRKDLVIPVANVLALFAKETGQGMQFELEAKPKSQNKPSTLRLVK